MKPKGWQIAGALLLLAVVALLIGWKLAHRDDSTPIASIAPEDARVLLFADPREAEATCGCGLIYRAVREAGANGVPVREVDPERELEIVQRHRVHVAPTVVILDENGREVRRHEGEAGETITAIRADLARLRGEAR